MQLKEKEKNQGADPVCTAFWGGFLSVINTLLGYDLLRA